MSHRTPTLDDKFEYNRAEHRRLKMTITVGWTLVVLGLLSLVNGVAARSLFTGWEPIVMFMMVLGVLLIILSVVVIATNRPRASRLASIKQSLDQLLTQLKSAPSGGELKLGESEEFGNSENGRLVATKESEAGDTWLVEVFTPSGMPNGPKKSFSAVLTPTALQQLEAGHPAYNYSEKTVSLLGDATNVVRSEVALGRAAIDQLGTPSSGVDEPLDAEAQIASLVAPSSR